MTNMSTDAKLTIPNATITALHASYVQHTGLQLPLNTLMAQEYSWGCWMAKGWTEADLRLVCAHIKREHPRYALKMMRFSRLIEDHQNFSEILAEARATQRNHRPPASAKSIVMREANMTEPEIQAEPKQASDVAEQILRMCQEARKAIDP